MEEETKENIKHYVFVSLIIIALLILQLKIMNLEKSVNEIHRINSNQEIYLNEFIGKTSKILSDIDEITNKLEDLQYYNYGQWFKLHSINTDELGMEMDSIAVSCGLGDLGLSTLNYMSDERIGLRFNSSVGVINLFIKNDSTITCQKDAFTSNETGCVELCNVPQENTPAIGLQE